MLTSSALAISSQSFMVIQPPHKLIFFFTAKYSSSCQLRYPLPMKIFLSSGRRLRPAHALVSFSSFGTIKFESTRVSMLLLWFFLLLFFSFFLFFSFLSSSFVFPTAHIQFLEPMVTKQVERMTRGMNEITHPRKRYDPSQADNPSRRRGMWERLNE